MSTSEVLRWLNEPELHIFGLSPKMMEKWSEEISRCYCEPWRHYHTLHHLSDMMNHLNTWRNSVTDYAAVVLAILFHDIVYNPQSSTNEADSVELFKKFADDVGLSDEVSQKVQLLITATIQHLPDDPSSADSDLTFFLDFDMAILGQPQQAYDVYAANIKNEYCHMSPEAFCKGRIKVLQTFMGRPKIYATKELKDVFEDQARLNMQREIESLQKQLESIM